MTRKGLAHLIELFTEPADQITQVNFSAERKALYIELTRVAVEAVQAVEMRLMVKL